MKIANFKATKIKSKLAYLVSENRLQMSFSSLEELIEAENPVRFVHKFVNHPFLKRLVTKINMAQVHKHFG